MKVAWDIIEAMDQEGAVHKTKGYNLGEVSLKYMLDHAREELDELEETLEPDSEPDILEFADIFSCLIHFGVRMGWSERSVEDALLGKLAERFDFGSTRSSM